MPVPEPGREYLRSIRRGEVELAEVVEAVSRAEAELLEVREKPNVPDQPDHDWVNSWLHRSHLACWSRLA